MCSLAKKNPKLAAVTAAMPLGTGLSGFAELFPDRFFDVAIAEQHAVTFSAGLAKSGVTPVAAIYSTFLQRAYDQIIHDVSLMKLHVVFGIDRCGLVGSDGETHQGVYDIAYMTQAPNMTVFSPSNRLDFTEMLEFAVNGMNTPVALRYPRGEVRDVPVESLCPYKSRLLCDGTDVFIERNNTPRMTGKSSPRSIIRTPSHRKMNKTTCRLPYLPTEHVLYGSRIYLSL